MKVGGWMRRGSWGERRLVESGICVFIPSQIANLMISGAKLLMTTSPPSHRFFSQTLICRTTRNCEDKARLARSAEGSILCPDKTSEREKLSTPDGHRTFSDIGYSDGSVHTFTPHHCQKQNKLSGVEMQRVHYCKDQITNIFTAKKHMAMTERSGFGRRHSRATLARIPFRLITLAFCGCCFPERKQLFAILFPRFRLTTDVENCLENHFSNLLGLGGCRIQRCGGRRGF